MALKQIKTNYHTHSTWCDGRYSTKEMILAAIEKVLHILAFQAMQCTPFRQNITKQKQYKTIQMKFKVSKKISKTRLKFSRL